MEHKFTELPDLDDIYILKGLVWKAILTQEQRIDLFNEIDSCLSYEEYDRIMYKIENLTDNFDIIPNPNMGDINSHLRKFCYL